MQHSRLLDAVIIPIVARMRGTTRWQPLPHGASVSSAAHGDSDLPPLPRAPRRLDHRGVHFLCPLHALQLTRVNHCALHTCLGRCAQAPLPLFTVRSHRMLAARVCPWKHARHSTMVLCLACRVKHGGRYSATRSLCQPMCVPMLHHETNVRQRSSSVQKTSCTLDKTRAYNYSSQTIRDHTVGGTSDVMGLSRGAMRA